LFVTVFSSIAEQIIKARVAGDSTTQMSVREGGSAAIE
jgi:hypothetical protein